MLARFGWPLDGYRRYITDNLMPTFADGELAIAGVNTARSNTWKDGRLAHGDIQRLREFFCAQPPRTFKILAAHHPFIPPARDPAPRWSAAPSRPSPCWPAAAAT